MIPSPAPRQASGAVPAVPNLQAVLAASSGPRFVELLWRFALLCLKLAWQRECQAQVGARQDAAAETAQVCPPAALPAAGASVSQGRVDVAEACLSLEISRCGGDARSAESRQNAAGLLGEDSLRQGALVDFRCGGITTFATRLTSWPVCFPLADSSMRRPPSQQSR